MRRSGFVRALALLLAALLLCAAALPRPSNHVCENPERCELCRCAQLQRQALLPSLLAALAALLAPRRTRAARARFAPSARATLFSLGVRLND